MSKRGVNGGSRPSPSALRSTLDLRGMSLGNMNAAADALAASLGQPPIRQQLLINSRLVRLTAFGQASLTLSRSLSSSRTGGAAGRGRERGAVVLLKD